jgi:iron(III) transport system substrate-binding protein
MMMRDTLPKGEFGMKALGCVLAIVSALLAAGCGGGGGNPSITVYSGREEELVQPLFDRFSEETGVEVEVRYGDSAELAAAIAEEGDGSPADVFFAQDPGSLGAVDAQLEELPQEILDRVEPRYRDDAGHWVGTSGRSRVLVYNTDALEESELPATVLDLTASRWKGKIGMAPTNASFQAFVTALRLTVGDDRTREWLEGLRANEPRTYEKNAPVVEAVAAGEIEVGLVNHYYLYLVKEEQPDAPIANHFFRPGDAGALVSVAGAGVLGSTEHTDEAERFVSFLLADAQQRFYVDDAEEAEYPIVAGIDAKDGLPPLADLQGPDVDLSALGPELEKTVELLRDTGFLT